MAVGFLPLGEDGRRGFNIKLYETYLINIAAMCSNLWNLCSR